MSVLVIDGGMHHHQIHVYTDTITLLLLFVFLGSVRFQFGFAGFLSLFRGLFALSGGGGDRRVGRRAKERQAQNQRRQTPAAPFPSKRVSARANFSEYRLEEHKSELQ